MFQDLIIILPGFLASLGIIVAGLTTHRKRLFILLAIVSGLSIIQYGLLGVWSALLISVIAVARNLSIAFLEPKHPKVNSSGAAVLFIVLFGIVFTVGSPWYSTPLPWFEWLPLIGAVLGTVAPLFKHMVLVKISLMTASITWLIFEFVKGSYGQMVGESFAILANLTAIIYLVVQHNRVGETVSDEKIEDLTTDIIKTITRPLTQIVTGSHKIVSPENTPPLLLTGEIKTKNPEL